MATTISYGLAVTAHFTLNKFLNFRNFERSTLSQFRTYGVVVVFLWIISMLLIEVGVRAFGLLPMQAKILAIAVNIPTGYVANRYLTFGGGIRGTWRRWQRSRWRR